MLGRSPQALAARRLERVRPAHARQPRVARATTSACRRPSSTSLVRTAIEAGAFGARLTGAGFGGCVVALVAAGRSNDIAATVTARYGSATGLAPPRSPCARSTAPGRRTRGWRRLIPREEQPCRASSAGSSRASCPGRFVWKDDDVRSRSSRSNPMMPGHTLVVPRDEVDHWIDLDPALAGALDPGRAADRSRAGRRVAARGASACSSSATRCRTPTCTSCRSTGRTNCRSRTSTGRPRPRRSTTPPPASARELRALGHAGSQRVALRGGARRGGDRRRRGSGCPTRTGPGRRSAPRARRAPRRRAPATWRSANGYGSSGSTTRFGRPGGDLDERDLRVPQQRVGEDVADTEQVEERRSVGVGRQRHPRPAPHGDERVVPPRRQHRCDPVVPIVGTERFGDRQVETRRQGAYLGPDVVRPSAATSSGPRARRARRPRASSTGSPRRSRRRDRAPAR